MRLILLIFSSTEFNSSDSFACYLIFLSNNSISVSIYSWRSLGDVEYVYFLKRFFCLSFNALYFSLNFSINNYNVFSLTSFDCSLNNSNSSSITCYFIGFNINSIILYFDSTIEIGLYWFFFKLSKTLYILA